MIFQALPNSGRLLTCLSGSLSWTRFHIRISTQGTLNILGTQFAAVGTSRNVASSLINATLAICIQALSSPLGSSVLFIHDPKYLKWGFVLDIFMLIPLLHSSDLVYKELKIFDTFSHDSWVIRKSDVLNTLSPPRTLHCPSKASVNIISEYILNKVRDSTQPCLTPLSIIILSVSLSSTRTEACCFQYKFYTRFRSLSSFSIISRYSNNLSCWTLSNAFSKSISFCTTYDLLSNVNIENNRN